MRNRFFIILIFLGIGLWGCQTGQPIAQFPKSDTIRIHDTTFFDNINLDLLEQLYACDSALSVKSSILPIIETKTIEKVVLKYHTDTIIKQNTVFKPYVLIRIKEVSVLRWFDIVFLLFNIGVFFTALLTGILIFKTSKHAKSATKTSKRRF